MESGVLTSENFSQVLRGLSQRRRQGVLEVRFPERVVQIFFLQGRIIDVRIAGENPASEVLEALKASGIVGRDFQSNTSEYASLFEELSGTAKIDEDLFERVVRHRILDRLYSIVLGEGVYYAFKAQMVEVGREFAASISAGQLLLDLVSIADSTNRFEAIFPAAEDIGAVGEEDPSFSEDEETVFRAAARPCKPDELVKRSMLSRYHFLEAALGLADRGKLKAGAAAAVVIPESGGELASILDTSLDSVIDDAFEGFAGGAEGADISAATEVEEEYDEEAAPGAGVLLSVWNAKLLYKNWIPNAVAAVLVGCAVAAPLFFWRGVFAAFSGF